MPIVIMNAALPPAPKPVVKDPADVALVKALDPWARTITSTTSTAGKAAVAYRKWKTAKKL